MTIENSIETLIAANTWTVLADGITASSYIFAEDQGSTVSGAQLILNPPHDSVLTSTNVVIVIYQSNKSQRRRFYGADEFLYEGVIKVYSGGQTALKTALTKLKTRADSDKYLSFYEPGIRQSNHRGKYMAEIRYEWLKIEAQS